MKVQYKYMVCTYCMTFNQAFYIKDTLNGFAMQEADFPMAFCIIDDASIDGEQEIIANWAEDHLDFSSSEAKSEQLEYGKRIIAPLKRRHNSLFVIVFLKENHYSQKKSKFNYIAEWHDNSKYLAICEGDDYWIHPGKLHLQVEFLETHPDYSTVYTNFDSYDVKEQKWRPSDLHKTISGELYVDIMAREVGIWSLTICYRASDHQTMPKVNDEDISQLDCFYFLHLSLCGKIHYLDEVTAVYRYMPGSMSHNKSTKAASKLQMGMAKCHLYYLERFPLTDKRLQKEMSKRYKLKCLSYCFYYKDWNMLKDLHISLFPIGNIRAIIGYLLYFLSHDKLLFRFISLLYELKLKNQN